MQNSNAVRASNRIVPVVKIVLLPTYISSGQAPLFVLHIRSGLAQPYEIFPLDHVQYDKYFKILDKSLSGLLQSFTTKAIDAEALRIKKLYQKKKSGNALDQLVMRNLIRYFQQNLLSLIHADSNIGCYHKIPKLDNKGFIIEKCQFSIAKITLHFEIDAKEKQLLTRYYLINDEKVLVHEVLRFGFLIYYNSTYYFLNWLDVQTLDWLDSVNWQALENNALLFHNTIVARLSNDYKIQTIASHAQIFIAAQPKNAIHLSELSNSMLVLSPKFKYGDIIVDGNFELEKTCFVDGQQVLIKRDLQHELDFLNYLKSLHPNFATQKDYFFLKFEEAKHKQWFLKVYHKLIAAEIEIIGFDLLQHFRYSPYPMEQVLQMKKTIDHLVYFEWEIYFGLHNCLLKDIQKMLLANQQSVMLTDGSIAMFEDEWIHQYGMLLRHAKIENHKLVAVPIWLCLSSQQLQDASKVEKIMPTEWLANWHNWQQESTPIIETPNNLNAALRPYQHKGFEWMELLSSIQAGGILSDDMGLGKTIQSITYLLHNVKKNVAGKHLIICPTSLVYNWEQEFKKFAPDLHVFIYTRGNKNMQDFLLNNFQICITTYGMIRADVSQFNTTAWTSIFLDESHYIKNLQAQVTKAVMQLNAKSKFCLTGTPILNHTTDLYAQFKFLLPDLLGSPEFFKKYYADAIDKYQSETHAKQLKSLVAPFILKRNKLQVAKDLPEKMEMILWCEMDEEQQIAYEDLKSQIKENVLTGISETGVEKATFSILAGISKLRQFCAAPQLIAETKHVSSSIKLALLVEEIKQLVPEHGVLVFSQYVGMLGLIAQQLSAASIDYYLMDGRTSMNDRAKLVADFQTEDATTKVFLLSLKTGNAGLNLTQADYVFLVDPWWNVAVEQQAIDRTHRIGQTKNVMAYRMICKNTIEEKMLQMQQQKTIVSDQLVAYDEGFVKQLSLDDLKFLFD